MTETVYNKPELVTFENHWKTKKATYERQRKSTLSGVACPKCGEELTVDRSWPFCSDDDDCYLDEFRAYCNNCDFEGRL